MLQQRSAALLVMVLAVAVAASSCQLDRSALVERCGDDTQCPPGEGCRGGTCLRLPDSDSGGVDAGRDAGRPDSSRDGSAPDSSLDGGGAPDANHDGAVRDAGFDAFLPLDGGPCVEAAPVSAAVAPVIGGALVCTPTGILTRSAEAAGLARGSDPGTALIDGTEVSACIEADFGSAVFREGITVRARAVSATCGASCMAATCGTGRQAAVFASADGVTYFRLSILNLTGTFEDHDLPLDGPAMAVRVCRLAVSPARDHVEVDFVGACTRP